MAIIVNNPPSTNTSEESSGMSGLVLVIFVIFLMALFVYLVVPLLRRVTTTPQVNIPDKIDVNVNTSQ